MRFLESNPPPSEGINWISWLLFLTGWRWWIIGLLCQDFLLFQVAAAMHGNRRIFIVWATNAHDAVVEARFSVRTLILNDQLSTVGHHRRCMWFIIVSVHMSKGVRIKVPTTTVEVLRSTVQSDLIMITIRILIGWSSVQMRLNNPFATLFWCVYPKVPVIR